MIYWSWDKSLSVGIDLIDNQHRRIVDYINELGTAYHEQDREKVSEILMGLIDYTATHFTFEEDLMRRSNYPLYDSHKKVHDSFVAHINTFVKQHDKGHDVTKRLISELQVWLTNHIKNDDADYAPYVSKSLSKNAGWISRTLGRLFG